MTRDEIRQEVCRAIDRRAEDIIDLGERIRLPARAGPARNVHRLPWFGHDYPGPSGALKKHGAKSLVSGPATDMRD